MDDARLEGVNQHKHNLSEKGIGIKQFRKRYYTDLKSFWWDFRYVISRRSDIKAAMQNRGISKAFRERLMMAVTEVNDCRYCRRFHTHQAFQAGIPEEEIKTYLSGALPEDIPNDQKLAVAYAKYWAERDADPEPESSNRLQEEYGLEGYQAIEILLYMIRMGNLLGNTWDYFLYRISFGNWGQRKSFD
jgi:AhpD family alkylhydroperoxidase